MGGFLTNLKRIGGAFVPPPGNFRTPPFLPPGTSTAPGMRPPIPNLPPQQMDVGDDDGAPAPQPAAMRPPPVIQRPDPQIDNAPPEPQSRSMPPQSKPFAVRPPVVEPSGEDMTENATPQASQPLPPPQRNPAPTPINRSAPPSWGEQAAKTDQARKDFEAVQRPLPPEKTGARRYIGAFLNGGVTGLASEALNPGQAYAQKKYAVDKENAGNKYALEEKALQDSVLEAQRQSQIEDRIEKQNIARDRVKGIKSETYRKDIKDRIGKREEDATYQAEGDPRPEGTEYIPNDEKPGFGWVVPAAYSALPKELAPFLPGHKEGQIIPYSKIKQATKDFNAAQMEDRKAANRPERNANETQLALDSVNPDPAISGPAKKALGVMTEQKKAGRTVVNVGDPMSGTALDRQAAYYHKTGGFMPGMARDKASQRAVANREAEMFPDSDLAENASGYKANRGSEANITKQADSVETFANTARKNLDLAVAASSKVDRAGSPLVNKYLNFLKGTVAGDADTHVLEVAVETAANEYAKVTSGQTSGASTDSARNQARGMLNAALSNGTLKTTVAYMNKEMDSRTTSYEEKLKEIRGRGKGGGGKPETASAPIYTQTATDPKTGKKVGWDGKSWQPIN